jgi:hypothetical protein
MPVAVLLIDTAGHPEKKTMLARKCADKTIDGAPSCHIPAKFMPILQSAAAGGIWVFISWL